MDCLVGLPIGYHSDKVHLKGQTIVRITPIIRGRPPHLLWDVLHLMRYHTSHPKRLYLPIITVMSGPVLKLDRPYRREDHPVSYIYKYLLSVHPGEIEHSKNIIGSNAAIGFIPLIVINK